MCRFAAWAGEPLPVAALFEAPHGLEAQAYRPRLLRSGHVNVDGSAFACWLDDGDGTPLRYATARPPWSDANLLPLARRLRGRMIVAAVRSATPGQPGGEDAAAPFVAGRLALAHNGWIEDLAGETGKRLSDALPAAAQAAVTVRTDSRLLFAHLLALDAEDPGLPADVLVERLAARIARMLREAGVRAQLNLAVADGGTAAAVRCSLGEPPNSLFVAEGTGALPGGALIASEPLDDDPAWQEVPDGGVVVIAPGRRPVLRAADLEVD
ncbi:MAG: ergothioneine biosynthesis protein EgtC [Acidobacteriota bacterium]